MMRPAPPADATNAPPGQAEATTPGIVNPAGIGVPSPHRARPRPGAPVRTPGAVGRGGAWGGVGGVGLEDDDGLEAWCEGVGVNL